MPGLLLCLILLSFAAYPFSEMRLEWGGTRIPYSGPLLAALLLACLLRLVGRGFRFRCPAPLLLATGGLWLSLLLPFFRGAPANWEWLLRYGLFFGTPLLVCIGIDSSAQLRKSLVVLLAVGVFLGLFGFYGFLTGDLGYYDLHYSESTRNGDAALMGSLLLIAVAYFLLSQPTGRRLLISLTLLALFGAGVLLSFSRSVWLGVATGVLFLAFSKRAVNRPSAFPLGRFVGISLLVLLAIFAIPEETWLQLGRRLTSIATVSNPDVSNQERLNLYGTVSGFIFVEGWLGVGARNFGPLLQKHAHHLRLQHAHNGYLNMWAEQGLLGLGSYLALTLYPVFILRRKLLYHPWSAVRWMDGGLLAVAVAWAVCSLFETLYFGLFYWLLYGMMLSASLLPDRDPAATANSRFARQAPLAFPAVPCATLSRIR